MEDNKKTSTQGEVGMDGKQDAKRGKKFKKNGKHGKNPSTEGNHGFKFSKQNPLEHWNQYPGLLLKVSALPWNHIKGFSYTGNGMAVNDTVFARFSFFPSIGINAGGASPLNSAFNKLWVNLNTEFRGVSNVYTAPDLGLVCIALGSLYLEVAEAARAYGVARYYSSKSRATGINLLHMLGYEYSFAKDLIDNLGDYNINLNVIIDKINNLVLPRGFSFTSEWVSLAGLLYKDSQDERAITLGFVPSGYYDYDDTITGVPNSLVFYKRIPDRNPFTYLQNIQDRVDKYLSNREIAKMCSDMNSYVKKHGIGQDYKEVCPNIPIDYVVAPIYSEALLNKIHNGMLTGCSTRDNRISCAVPTSLKSAIKDFIAGEGLIDFVITQLNGNIISNYCVCNGEDSVSDLIWFDDAKSKLSYPSKVIDYGDGDDISSIKDLHYGDSLCDTWMEDPDITVKVEAQLFKYCAEFITQENGDHTEISIVQRFTQTGFAVLDSLVFYNMDEGLDQRAGEIQPWIYSDFNLQYAAELTKMDWHPLIYNYAMNSGIPITNKSILENGLLGNVFEVIGDLDNAYVIPKSSTKQILDVTMLSGYTIPITNLDTDIKVG